MYTIAAATASVLDWSEVAFPLAAAALTLAASWGIQKNAIKTSETRLDKIEADANVCAKDRSEISERAGRIDERQLALVKRVESLESEQKTVSKELAALSHLPEQLKELSSKIDRLLEMFHTRKD
jgi:archaellum component FlaC